MTSPYGVRTPSGVNGARTRAGGWFPAVVAGARRAGFALLMLGLVSLVPGVSPAYAGEDGLTWTVSEVNGKVWVDHDGTGWQALKTGTVLKRGSRVKTGMGGRAVLKRPGDSIASSPNSRFRIPTSDEKGAVAHFVQTLGTLLFKLKSRPQDPFNVRTPYLAAVVKGTTFTVTVDAEGAALHVSSGAVEVTSVLDGVNALIRAGQTAAVSATPGTGMRVLGAGKAGSPRRSPNKDTGKTTKEQKPEVKSDAAGASSKPAPKTTAAGRGTGGIFGERRGGNVARGGDIVITRQLGAPRINIGAVTKGLIKQSLDAGTRPAKAATKSRRHSRPAEAAAQQAGGTWTDIIAVDGWANRLPVLGWLIAIQGIALLTQAIREQR